MIVGKVLPYMGLTGTWARGMCVCVCMGAGAGAGAGAGGGTPK